MRLYILKSNDVLPLKCLYIIVHHWLSFACYFAANLPIFLSLNDDFGCLELLDEHENKDISNDHDGYRLWTFPMTMMVVGYGHFQELRLTCGIC
jgi:hypothetical protein